MAVVQDWPCPERGEPERSTNADPAAATAKAAMSSCHMQPHEPSRGHPGSRVLAGADSLGGRARGALGGEESSDSLLQRNWAATMRVVRAACCCCASSTPQLGRPLF